MTLDELTAAVRALLMEYRPPPPARVPALVWPDGADVSDPDRFPILIRFETDRGPEWELSVVQRVTWILAELPGLTLTTRRPDLKRGGYGEIVVGVPLVGHAGAAGLSPARWRIPNPGEYPNMEVLIDINHDPLREMTPDDVFLLVLHELGHAVGGWGLGHWPEFRSAEWWEQCKAGVAVCVEASRVWREAVVA